MRLVLKRLIFTNNSTIGKLYVDGNHLCDTLEDVVRPDGGKVHGKTAIPAGTYEVAVTMSNRFGRLMPLLKDVPNFAGVRIHTGNKPEDTEGCILVGTASDGVADFIGYSKNAYERLFPVIKSACDKCEQVTITIEDGRA